MVALVLVGPVYAGVVLATRSRPIILVGLDGVDW
jgi:hypothetical protein